MSIKMRLDRLSKSMNDKKTHIFSENLLPDGVPRSWSYGPHKNLSLAEVEAIKKTLGADVKIIQVDFSDPENYKYPSNEKND